MEDYPVRPCDRSVLRLDDVKFRYLLLHPKQWQQNHLIYCEAEGVEKIDSWKRNEVFKDPTAEFAPADLHLSGSGKFWLCCVVDCAFPAFFVVQADDIEEALNLYVEHSASPRLDELAVKDMDPETVQYADNGVPYDNEQLHIEECDLISVLF